MSKIKTLQKSCSEIIVKGIEPLSIVIPDINYTLSTILDTVRIQKMLGEVVLQEIPATSSGCWNFSMRKYKNKRTALGT